MWRPDNWEGILREICGENPHPYGTLYVETGANAILEALKQLDLSKHSKPPVHGWLVFIPDQEENDG
jgi:hypothetical protein